MRIFVSVGFNSCIKKNYKIISKEVAVIDIESITKELSITDYKTNIYSRFILNEEIKKKFNYFYVSKRFKAILYVTRDLDENVIKNLKSFLSTTSRLAIFKSQNLHTVLTSSSMTSNGCAL